jgi:hypothetical protein
VKFPEQFLFPQYFDNSFLSLPEFGQTQNGKYYRRGILTQGKVSNPLSKQMTSNKVLKDCLKKQNPGITEVLKKYVMSNWF